MKFGVCIPHYGIPLDVDNMTDMAVKAEEMGFDSVWVTDLNYSGLITSPSCRFPSLVHPRCSIQRGSSRLSVSPGL